MGDVILDGNIAFLKGSKTTVVINGMNRNVGGKSDGANIKELKPEKWSDNKPWALWGDDDLFPETVRENVKTSIMLSRGLQHKAKLLYGNGILTYKLDEAGSIVPFTDPNFEKFKRDSHLEHYLSRVVYQHEYYNNIFPRLIFSADKKKVNKLICEKSRYGRWEKINASSGKINNCYISAWFDQYPNPNDSSKVKKVPAINLFDDVDEIMADTKNFEYVYRAMYPLSNDDYYAVAAWQSAVESGWVEVEKRVPELKKYMFTNGMFPKHHIQIPITHWEQKFKDQWDKFDEKQKKEKVIEQLKEINDFLSGSENAYKAFISHFGIDSISGKAQDGWKIEKIDNGDNKGEFLAEIDEANTQITYALGLNRALFGSNHNGQGAGSGSDIRESFLIATSMLRLDRDFIFMPLYFIRDYNGWDPDMLFGFRDTVLTTLDKNPTGSQKVVSN